MKKKTFLYLVLSLFVALSVFAQWRAVYAEDTKKPETLYGVSVGESRTVTAKYEDGAFPGKVMKAKAVYDDKYFSYTESAAYVPGEYEQGELARLSMLASAAAYKGKYAKQLLKDCGFEDVKYITSEVTREDNDHVSFAIGRKTLGEDAVIAILVRGTGTEYEWVSNFNLGTGEVHTGFSNAEQELNGKLNQYLKRHPVKGSFRFWIAGHSRGAAVGNLLAKRLTDQYGKDSVYAYTFATPRVAVSAARAGYENILNYLNPGDFVTEVAPEKWGYGRYGVDRTLTAGTKAAMKKAFRKKTGEGYEGFTAEEKEDYLNTLLSVVGPDRNAYRALQFFVFVILGKVDTDEAFGQKFSHAHCPTSYICWLKAMYA